jgi:hypothetical protein
MSKPFATEETLAYKLIKERVQANRRLLSLARFALGLST